MTSLAHLGAITGLSWFILIHLWQFGGVLGTLLSNFEAILDHSRSHLEQSWVIFGAMLAHLGLSWDCVGASWGHLGISWDHPGTKSFLDTPGGSPSEAILGSILGPKTG